MPGESEMPKYKCHKEVWALKIADLYLVEEGGAVIVPTEEGYANIDMTQEWFDKHEPEIGGYYVVYKDGYKSFSPAEAFEDGYTLIK